MRRARRLPIPGRPTLLVLAGAMAVLSGFAAHGGPPGSPAPGGPSGSTAPGERARMEAWLARTLPGFRPLPGTGAQADGEAASPAVLTSDFDGNGRADFALLAAGSFRAHGSVCSSVHLLLLEASGSAFGLRDTLRLRWDCGEPPDAGERTLDLRLVPPGPVAQSAGPGAPDTVQLPRGGLLVTEGPWRRETLVHHDGKRYLSRVLFVAP